MSEKHSIASRARWAHIPAEQRSVIMSGVAISRWSKMTPKEKEKQLSIMRKGKK